MAGYWERRAEKARRTKAIQQETNLKVKAINEALKTNKIACKQYLDVLKESGRLEEYKAKKAYYDKQWKENEAWSKLEIKCIRAESKHETKYEVGAVDERISKFARWRLDRAAKAMSRAVKKVSAYLDNLAIKHPSTNRQKQIENKDLSFVTANDFYDPIRQTTVEEVENGLREGESTVAAEPLFEVDREEVGVERETVYERVTLQSELERNGRAHDEREEESLSLEESLSASERSPERSEISTDDLELN